LALFVVDGWKTEVHFLEWLYERLNFLLLFAHIIIMLSIGFDYVICTINLINLPVSGATGYKPTTTILAYVSRML
jgi:hypothetical protein